MSIVVFGLNHKSAPLALREKVTIPESRLADALDFLRAGNPDALESLILSTCNRTEIYARLKTSEDGSRSLARFLADYSQIDPLDLAEISYFHADDEAITHLFRVTSSLDSMVVGEPQIVGQVKEAWRAARESASIGLILNQLFESSFQVAKRIRSETEIGRKPVSVASAAVELTEKIFSDLSSKVAMLIGAGEMIELIARHLMARGVKTVLVSNRTFHRAARLARELSGAAINFDQIPEELRRCDIVITSTGAPHFIVRRAAALDAIAHRPDKPIFFVDIAVPRDVEPTINEIPNCYVYDIDDLKSVVDSNLSEREAEALKAEKIIAAEAGAFRARLDELEMKPLIIGLRARFEEIRRAEMLKGARKLKDLSPEEIAVVDRITENIVKKIIHEPIVNLKKSADQTIAPTLVGALKRLFRI